MKQPPKFATALLRRIAADQPALIGDLLEQVRSGRSTWWYWQQVLAFAGRAVLCEVHGSIWWSGAAITAAVLILDLPLVIRGVGYAPVPVDPRRLLLMTLFLAPQALVIAVPVGLTVRMVQRRLRRAVVYAPAGLAATVRAQLFSSVTPFKPGKSHYADD